MFFTDQQFQLCKLLIQVDWMTEDTEKRQIFLEFRLVSFIMTAGKKGVWIWAVADEVARWSWRYSLQAALGLTGLFQCYQHLIISLLWNTGLFLKTCKGSPVYKALAIPHSWNVSLQTFQASLIIYFLSIYKKINLQLPSISVGLFLFLQWLSTGIQSIQGLD